MVENDFYPACLLSILDKKTHPNTNVERNVLAN